MRPFLFANIVCSTAAVPFLTILHAHVNPSVSTRSCTRRMRRQIWMEVVDTVMNESTGLYKLNSRYCYWYFGLPDLRYPDFTGDLPIFYIIMKISRSSDFECKSPDLLKKQRARTTPRWRNKVSCMMKSNFSSLVFTLQVLVTWLLTVWLWDLRHRFSALKSSRKNLLIVFSINMEISIFRGPSTCMFCITECLLLQEQNNASSHQDSN